MLHAGLKPARGPLGICFECLASATRGGGSQMKAQRVHGKPAVILLIAVLLSLVLASSQSGRADPGIAPAPAQSLVVLDFSPFPNGAPIRQGVLTWTGQGWSAGAGSLQLLYPGAFLEVVFQGPGATSSLQLKLVHRSAYAPGCPNQGFAPVTIAVNNVPSCRVTPRRWALAPRASRAISGMSLAGLFLVPTGFALQPASCAASTSSADSKSQWRPVPARWFRIIG